MRRGDERRQMGECVSKFVHGGLGGWGTGGREIRS